MFANISCLLHSSLSKIDKWPSVLKADRPHFRNAIFSLRFFVIIKCAPHSPSTPLRTKNMFTNVFVILLMKSKPNSSQAVPLHSTTFIGVNKEIKHHVYDKRQTWDSHVCFLEKMSTKMKKVQYNFDLWWERKVAQFFWETENSEW